jgi:hypothetical protein
MMKLGMTLAGAAAAPDEQGLSTDYKQAYQQAWPAKQTTVVAV